MTARAGEGSRQRATEPVGTKNGRGRGRCVQRLCRYTVRVEAGSKLGPRRVGVEWNGREVAGGGGGGGSGGGGGGYGGRPPESGKRSRG
jgi:hypothetical protein